MPIFMIHALYVFIHFVSLVGLGMRSKNKGQLVPTYNTSKYQYIYLFFRNYA